MIGWQDFCLPKLSFPESGGGYRKEENYQITLERNYTHISLRVEQRSDIRKVGQVDKLYCKLSDYGRRTVCVGL